MHRKVVLLILAAFGLVLNGCESDSKQNAAEVHQGFQQLSEITKYSKSVALQLSQYQNRLKTLQHVKYQTGAFLHVVTPLNTTFLDRAYQSIHSNWSNNDGSSRIKTTLDSVTIALTEVRQSSVALHQYLKDKDYLADGFTYGNALLIQINTQSEALNEFHHQLETQKRVLFQQHLDAMMALDAIEENAVLQQVLNTQQTIEQLNYAMVQKDTTFTPNVVWSDSLPAQYDEGAVGLWFVYHKAVMQPYLTQQVDHLQDISKWQKAYETNNDYVVHAVSEISL